MTLYTEFFEIFDAIFFKMSLFNPLLINTFTVIKIFLSLSFSHRIFIRVHGLTPLND